MNQMIDHNDDDDDDEASVQSCSVVVVKKKDFAGNRLNLDFAPPGF